MSDRFDEWLKKYRDIIKKDGPQSIKEGLASGRIANPHKVNAAKFALEEYNEQKQKPEPEQTGVHQFEPDYDDLIGDVINANYKTYEQKLRDFYNFIDNSPFSAPLIRDLEKDIDFSEWYDGCKKTMTGMLGSGKLDWAQDKTERLGQLLALFRHFSQKQDEFSNFCSHFMYAGSRYDDMVYEINSQVFEPFARDLLKHITNSNNNAQRERALPSRGEVPFDEPKPHRWLRKLQEHFLIALIVILFIVLVGLATFISSADTIFSTYNKYFSALPQDKAEE